MRILIIDDIAAHAQQLERLIKEITREKFSDLGKGLRTGMITDGREAVKEAVLGTLQADYVFIDINMPGENGIDIAAKLEKLMPGAQFVFVSSYDDYYLDVYDVEHIYFIHKPYEEEHVEKALERIAVRERNTGSEYFDYEVGRTAKRLLFKNILFFESRRRQIIIYTVQNPETEDVFYGTIGDLEERLPENFVRCHRGFIINTDRIESLSTDSAVISGHRIPVSRKYKDSVHEAFCRVINGRLRI